MNNKTPVTLNNGSILGNTISWLFGIVVITIGIINMFWGNDPGYGIFIFLLAFVYFPPATALFKKNFRPIHSFNSKGHPWRFNSMDRLRRS